VTKTLQTNKNNKMTDVCCAEDPITDWGSRERWEGIPVAEGGQGQRLRRDENPTSVSNEAGACLFLGHPLIHLQGQVNGPMQLPQDFLTDVSSRESQGSLPDFVHEFNTDMSMGPDIPDDLYHLIKKSVNVRKHLECNRKDKDAKFRLILIESRMKRLIHRFARYYRMVGWSTFTSSSFNELVYQIREELQRSQAAVQRTTRAM
jgi:ribosomal protein S15P/S13E